MAGKGKGIRKKFSRWQQSDCAALAAIKSSHPNIKIDAADDPTLNYHTARFRMATFLAAYSQNINHVEAAKIAGVPMRAVRFWRKNNPWFVHQLNRVIAQHEALDQWVLIFKEMDRRAATGEVIDDDYRKILNTFRSDTYAVTSRHQRQVEHWDDYYTNHDNW